MKLSKIFVFKTAVALAIAFGFLFLSESEFFTRLELSGLDLFFRLRGPLPFNQKLIIIEITDADIEKVGRWPWPRSWHAALQKALSDLGARSVFFDIILSEESDETDDALFQEALTVTKNCFLPFAFQDSPPSPQNALFPLRRFREHIRGIGSINMYPDIDGIARRIPLIFPTPQGVYTHAALAVAMGSLGMDIESIRPDRLIISNKDRSITIPLIKPRTMLINWLGEWPHTFKHYSFLDVLAGYKDLIDGRTPAITVGDFKDAVCIVAVTAIGQYDIKPVPLEPEYPGVGVTATAISDILDNRFIFHPPSWVYLVVLFVMALLPAFMLSGERALGEMSLILLFGFASVSVAFFLFLKGIYVACATPLFALFISSTVIGVTNFFQVSIERQLFFELSIIDGLTKLYNIRYFRRILEMETNLANHNPALRFSIAMCDIDHFKEFNDTYGHLVGDLVLKESAAVIKSSVRSVDVVARYGGEEFIIFLRGASLEDGIGIGEYIRRSVENKLVRDSNNSYQITVSVGIASFFTGDDVDAIIKRADDFLYLAKKEGRNCVRPKLVEIKDT